jgi:outer membrane biosynthesis protein TonB
MYNTYPQHQNYGPQHHSVQGYGYAPMQQPMPMQQMPVAQPAAASKGLLMVAGLAVAGAAAFGGVYLMNSSSAEQTAASQPSTVFNIPSEISIPTLTTDSGNDPATSPVIVNNPAPVRVFTPSAPQSVGSPAPVQQKPVAQKPVEEPKKEEPKKEEPKKEEPKKEEPKKEEPKKEEPKKEEPKKEEPKKEEPKKEEPNPAPAPGPDDLIDYGGCVCG